MNRKEFDKKFGRRIHLSFECSDAESLFNDVWQWIEQYGTEQRIDELQKIMIKDNGYHTQYYCIHTDDFKNRIKELNETLIK